jgi:restriction endonuclease, S subunit
MKKYDEYKDSGVAWIGEVPKHWEVLHLKHSLDGLQDGTHGTYASVDAGKVLLSAKNVTEHGLIIGESERTISDIDHKEIVSNGFPQQGDILLCCVGTLGRCCIFEYPFPIAFQRSVTFLRTNSLLSNRMLLYILRNKYIDTQFQLFAKTSAQSGVYMGDLKDFYIVVPPITEQVAIAAYLDTHCAKIDNLISIQQKRIALLQELKQSVITHAVTKGLNPNVEMKQSGVEWIGDVPKHWEVRKIKQCCNKEQYSIKTGPFGSQLKGEELMSQGDVSVYSQQNVINNDFNKIRYFVSNKKAKSLSSFYTRANDVLITSRGTIGKAAILQPLYPKGILHPCLIAIRLDQEVCLPEWLTMYINETDCFKTDISVNSNATTIDVIYTGTLKDIYIPIPTISEQAAIASYLDRKCATIDTSISNAQHQIELLQEYKQSLITEVVTGKRKVTDN